MHIFNISKALAIIGIGYIICNVIVLLVILLAFNQIHEWRTCTRNRLRMLWNFRLIILYSVCALVSSAIGLVITIIITITFYAPWALYIKTMTDHHLLQSLPQCKFNQIIDEKLTFPYMRISFICREGWRWWTIYC